MSESQHVRWLAGALVAGAAAWLLAGLLVVAQPYGLSAEQVYATLVPVALLALLVGARGLKAWLGGFQRKAHRRSGLRGFASGLEAMSSQRHRAVAGAGSADDGLSARGLGAGALAVGVVFVVGAGALTGSGTGLRSTMFFGWFLFFAGAFILGLAVVFSEELPRWAGGLLAVGSLLVLSVAATGSTGAAERPEALGPLLPTAGGASVVALVLWILSGVGWACLGVALWRRGSIEAATVAQRSAARHSAAQRSTVRPSRR